MFVWATRTLWAMALRAAFFAGLFVVVIVMQVALVTALRAGGWSPPAAIAASGSAVLAIVLGVHYGLRFRAARAARALDRERERLGLPHGPCCVVWRGEAGDDIPWDVEGQLHAEYPPVAERLKIEGFAVVDFEVGHDGRAKNLHCVDYWPAPVFYQAAADALRAASFTSSDPNGPRFGPSYRIPFVFRIRGASKLNDRGRKARKRGRRARATQRRLRTRQPS